METQYKSLVAETSGRECTLAGAISRAGPLIEEGFTYVSGGAPERALDVYSDAIKVRVRSLLFLFSVLTPLRTLLLNRRHCIGS